MIGSLLAPLRSMTRRRGDRSRAAAAAVLAIALAGCALAPSDEAARATAGDRFTIAMVPDTQNYVDYSHQRAEGFALDAADLFQAQMAWIAGNARSRGGDVAFVASVGDTWQHPTKWIDPEHAARGIGRVDNPFFAGHFDPTEKVRTVEMPAARAGYQKLAAVGLPFGVPPGNHDYDAMYNVDRFPPNLEALADPTSFSWEDLGVLHVGGLENFLSVFGAESDFFADAPWYVDAHRGGTSSAQIFEAGGYRFLHLALEMQAGDDALAWARGVIARHPGLPTIVSTHDYLTPRATRVAGGFLDFTRVDPAYHNTPQQIFEKLVAPSDQIFLVLCGHYHGQARLAERNAAGHVVHTILADYQDRGQAGIDAGAPATGGLMGGPTGLGDGWLRLLEFDTTVDPPRLDVRTWSTHYGAFADDLPEYAAWYRAHEQPDMTDAEFLAEERFTLVLDDFRARFGPPAAAFVSERGDVARPRRAPAAGRVSVSP